MEEPTNQPGQGGMKREWLLLAALLGLATGLHLWLLDHTEVTARDSIGYIRYAWELQHKPWGEVIANAEQHPGYPILIFGMSRILEQFVAQPLPILMQWSAQLVSALASVLLVVPMFLLGKELFNARVGFWAALLMQVLPVSSRILADGLSEATFLLFAVTALLFGFRALRDGLAWQFIRCGFFAGLAYLTRPEGGADRRLRGADPSRGPGPPAWRRPWRTALTCGVGLGVAALAVGGPFVAATGRITVKPSATQVLQAALESQPAPGSGSPAVAMMPLPIFAVWDDVPGPGPERSFWSLKAVALELVKGFYYVGWLPVLLGLWWFRGSVGRQPGVWMLGVLCLVILFFLWRVAKVMGYVSDRHMLLVLLCGSYWAVAAIFESTRRLAVHGGRLRFAGHRLAPGGLLLLAAGAGFAKSLEPLHANRGGFREAGLWLAEHSTPLDDVKDPYCWAHYYAGRVFIEGKATAAPDGHLPVWYVVVEQAKSQHERLKGVAEVQVLKELGRRVWSWDGRRGKEQAEVAIYEVPAAAALQTHFAPGSDR